MEFKDIVKVLEECENLNNFYGSEDQRNNKKVFLEKLKEAFNASTGEVEMVHGQPIIHTEASASSGSRFGVNRDRFPDSGWDELRTTNLDFNKTTVLKLDTKELKLTVLEDLAYAYGRNTKKFSEKIEEFKILG